MILIYVPQNSALHFNGFFRIYLEHCCSLIKTKRSSSEECPWKFKHTNGTIWAINQKLIFVQNSWHNFNSQNHVYHSLTLGLECINCGRVCNINTHVNTVTSFTCMYCMYLYLFYFLTQIRLYNKNLFNFNIILFRVFRIKGRRKFRHFYQLESCKQHNGTLTRNIFKPDAHGPQWLTWVNCCKSLIQQLSTSVAMAINQNEVFV